MAIATLAQLKGHLKIASTADDALLTRILAGVEMAIARECRRVFGQASSFSEASRTEFLTAVGLDTIFLSSYPVVSISSIQADEDRDFDSATALIENTDYLVDKDTGIVTRLGSYWPFDRGTVKVAYVAGYEAAGADHVAGHYAMPADLTNAVIMQAAFEYGRAGKEGITSTSAGGGNVTLYQPEGLLPGVKKMIAPFKRLV